MKHEGERIANKSMNKKYNYKFEIGKHIHEFIIRPKKHLETLNWKKDQNKIQELLLMQTKTMHIEKNCKIDISKHIK